MLHSLQMSIDIFNSNDDDKELGVCYSDVCYSDDRHSHIKLWNFSTWALCRPDTAGLPPINGLYMPV